MHPPVKSDPTFERTFDAYSLCYLYHSKETVKKALAGHQKEPNPTHCNPYWPSQNYPI
ncbi:hypothetical protein HanPSC8_Chr13g0557581 [Helianthus annuus]|nr:hypothetical protein HanPSC8_Chr13g0557581 [Helianthus annuus]